MNLPSFWSEPLSFLTELSPSFIDWTDSVIPLRLRPVVYRLWEVAVICVHGRFCLKAICGEHSGGVVIGVRQSILYSGERR